MDGYALKRAKALLNRVGVIRFHQLLDEVMKSEFTVESATKEDAEIDVPQCRLELPNSGSGNHGSETGVRLCGRSTSVPSGCDENGGCYDCRNVGMNPTQ